MKILLELPDAFAEHFAMDKFKDSFMRICADILEVNKRRKLTHQHLPFISGNYERELVDVLAPAFANAKVLQPGTSNKEAALKRALYKACENWALTQTALSDIWEQGEPGAWMKMRDRCQKLREGVK